MSKQLSPSTQESLASVAAGSNVAREPKSSALKEVIELVSKGLVGFAGLCYVLGLIVVAMHLRHYGLNSLSLPQLHYITAGVWVLLPIAALTLAFIFGKFVIDAQKNAWLGKSRFEKTREMILAIISVTTVSLVTLEFLGRAVGVQLSLTNWLLIPALGTLAVGCVVVASIGIVMNANTPQMLYAGVGIAVLGVVLFLVYLVLFAGRTYQEIPWATGGGRPSQVELVVSSEAKPYLESVGVKFSAGQNRSDSLKLLLATEKEYVILDAAGRAISIPADSVKSLLYEK